jgi:hypothetical protein
MGEPAPAPAPRQAAPHVSYIAPVSRGAPSVTGRPVENRITLNAEERDIARRTYSDLPPEKAERLYAEVKGLMLRRRANGTLNE